MRKFLAGLVVLLIFKTAYCQDEFKECFKNILSRMDSVTKLGQSFIVDDWKNCVIDRPIPNFIATTINGDTIEIKKLRGKVVVLNFWMIDCRACITELPGLNKLVEEFRRSDVVFLAITWDAVKRIREEFLPKYQLDFVILPDAQAQIDRIAMSGYPTTYFIDKQGIIKIGCAGCYPIFETGKSAIEKLLKSQ